jgi:hypothetical protein
MRVLREFHRETKQDYFGKCGISVFGALLIFNGVSYYYDICISDT